MGFKSLYEAIGRNSRGVRCPLPYAMNMRAADAIVQQCAESDENLCRSARSGPSRRFACSMPVPVLRDGLVTAIATVCRGGRLLQGAIDVVELIGGTTAASVALVPRPAPACRPMPAALCWPSRHGAGAVGGGIADASCALAFGDGGRDPGALGPRNVGAVIVGGILCSWISTPPCWICDAYAFPVTRAVPDDLPVVALSDFDVVAALSLPACHDWRWPREAHKEPCC